MTKVERTFPSAAVALKTTENGVRSSSSVVSYAPKMAISLLQRNVGQECPTHRGARATITKLYRSFGLAQQSGHGLLRAIYWHFWRSDAGWRSGICGQFESVKGSN